MRTCWCPVERSPYWPTPAATLPALNHRRDRHFRTTRSRMRASWGRPPASLPVHSSADPSPALVIRVIKPLNDLNEALRHALIDDLAVHQPQLHPDFRFDIGSELNHRIFFGFLCVHGSYSKRWVVLVHRAPRARGVMCPLHFHSWNKLTNVRHINRFRVPELFSQPALREIAPRR